MSKNNQNEGIRQSRRSGQQSNNKPDGDSLNTRDGRSKQSQSQKHEQ